ncbi:SRPBCC domain-containing protein [Mycobacterium sp. IS-1496]|uniref:SRPBCC family protein n=1 Tax=Mycobacterium sp. IS-1496 TaxID=1772284 RepID=UPI000B233335|nr:SRPBCC domain-containing protein [Mycobacterium sp. IS-1496]
MPVRKDDGRRWVEMELVVPGTPEQVWDAMATGPGMSAWFTPTTVEERVGGALHFDFGGGAVQRGVVTGWEPPRRLTYEEHEWSGIGTPGPLATEITVTARSGGTCVVRMVHSLFADGDDWDDELEGFEAGWPGFFDVLRLYLRDFAGRPATPVRVMAEYPGDVADGWSRLASGLGLAGVDVGDRPEPSSQAPEFGGAVERIDQTREARRVMLRLDRPGVGIAIVGAYPLGERMRAMVSLYLYGDSAADLAAAQQQEWSRWLDGVLGRDPIVSVR